VGVVAADGTRGSPNEKGRRKAGPFVTMRLMRRSIRRDDWTAEGIVHANRTDIGVLTDMVSRRESAKRSDGVDIAATGEQVVILDAHGPVRREADFYPGAGRAAPSGFACGINKKIVARDEGPIIVADDGATALKIPEHIVPGVADLSGEQAEGVDLGFVGKTGNGKSGPSQTVEIVTREVSALALCFEAEDPIRCLPAIANLAADSAAGCVMAAFAH